MIDAFGVVSLVGVDFLLPVFMYYSSSLCISGISVSSSIELQYVFSILDTLVHTSMYTSISFILNFVLICLFLLMSFHRKRKRQRNQ